MSGDEGFLSRWAKRKAHARSGAVAPVETRAGSVDAPAQPLVATGQPAPAAATPAAAVAPLTPPTPPLASVAEPLPLPTMADVAQLTRSSDFSSFVQPGVDPSVSNAAMKKLFSDPRYNVMDGLDTYIDDYSTPDPIPLAMLRRMNQAAFLGLFDREAENDALGEPRAAPAGAEAARTDADAAAPAAPPEAFGQDGSGVPANPSSMRADDDTDL
jgi:hypothetical protein